MNGLLVHPARTKAISISALQIVNNNKLRINLINKALETVKEYTLEKQRDKIINIMEKHFGLEFR